ncbi:PREDICTED: T-cell leukemia/lymphoma protein 1A [Myotis davidii]|uniref:T-cell leukemia/lymphoma protein 1A n=1 Tax=Myotis davidii TaxID=225400 RepID=UPI0007673BDB|nr:PREDICTED: T-cell leukemia/lymphoma protein 1A [Myotis davidii]
MSGLKDLVLPFRKTPLDAGTAILPAGPRQKAEPTCQTESSLQVLMRQIEVSHGEAMQPSRLPPSMLPLMWQLYPGRRYRASDSSFWRIVYHIEISGIEDMVLEQLPDP